MNRDKTKISNLKNELNLIKVLKNFESSNYQKDDLIKMIKEKVKNIELENKNISSQIQDNLDKYNDEMLKRSEDLIQNFIDDHTKDKKIDVTENMYKYPLIVSACSSIHVFKKLVAKENEFYLFNK